MENEFSSSIKPFGLSQDFYIRHLMEDKRLLQTIAAAMEAPAFRSSRYVHTTPWYFREDVRDGLQPNPVFQGYQSYQHITTTRKKPIVKDNTGALKLWLIQHKKNPYPNKPEKIMLAILSRMTLTQVSTWFANARRRLKKEFPEDDFDFFPEPLQKDEHTDTLEQI